MKVKIWLIAIFLLAGCSQVVVRSTLLPGVTPSVTPGKVGVTVIPAPSVQLAAQQFLQAWKNEKYADMYAMLTKLSQDSITKADFEKRYRDAAIAMTLKNLDYTVLSTLTRPASGQAAYTVTFHTNQFKDIDSGEMVMNLSIEDGVWRIGWDDGMILPELRGGNQLALDYSSPGRGIIYDVNGHALAAEGDAVALGVVPGQIDPKQEKTLLDQLSMLTGLNTDTIQNLYKHADPTWYIPVGEASQADVQAHYDTLTKLSGLQMNAFRSRYYADGGVAAQTIGHVAAIPAESLEQYERLGYQLGDRIGIDGIEKWADTSLSGKHGYTLYVKDSKGQIVNRLAESDSVAAQNVTTTLDMDLQTKLQKSMGNFRGAIVVMERDTGRILAMVSSPTYDPNLFEPTNKNFVNLQNILNNQANPLYNRATQGAYPLGSVFKIITMSTALQSGIFKNSDTYNCQYTFTEEPGVTLYDWTYYYKVPPSGIINLSEGLMRSCDPYFYHIGLTLYNDGHQQDVTRMAQSFGLGSKTGIIGLDPEAESPGSIPQPQSLSDAVNQAIGQGQMLVTPLQVADFVAAVGNGGTLYVPNLIDKIAPPDGNPTYTFSPKVRGTLAVSADNLKLVQEAMRSVVANKHGTGYYVLANLSVPVTGKTGTAQNSNDLPHAWFAGYSIANDPKHPDISVAVVVENVGEGADYAAPIFRRVMSLYFSDGTNTGGLLPWESRPYVVASPTPNVTDTPTATPSTTETPTPKP